jgi:hypothetical protein
MTGRMASAAVSTSSSSDIGVPHYLGFQQIARRIASVYSSVVLRKEFTQGVGASPARIFGTRLRTGGW